MMNQFDVIDGRLCITDISQFEDINPFRIG